MDVFITTYWPFQAGLSAAAKRLEGGTNDREGNPLHTLEDHLADPSSAPFVSCAGDPAIFAYGQRIDLPSLGAGVVARVVDTGGHFHGPHITPAESRAGKKGKVIRAAGYEPIDVCVASSSSSASIGVGKQTATVLDGDTGVESSAAVDNPDGSGAAGLGDLLLDGADAGAAAGFVTGADDPGSSSSSGTLVMLGLVGAGLLLAALATHTHLSELLHA